MKWVLGLAVLAVGCFAAMQAQGQADEMKPGLVCEVFGMPDAVEDFPTIPADKKPTVKKVDAQINVDVGDEKWPGTELSDQFYIRWTGTVKIEKDGKYKFFLESDDGSRMFIGDKKVVDNPGLHAAEEQSGEIELKAGEHPIKVEYFENGGQAVCKMSWQTEGVDKQIVPAKALLHKKSAE